MDAVTKLSVGKRLRMKREQAGYTRERLGEICSLSPRFIANVELGDSTFSLDSLIAVCRALSCSADYLLFGDTITEDGWETTISKLHHLDVKYQPEIDKLLQAAVEAVIKAERQ